MLDLKIINGKCYIEGALDNKDLGILNGIIHEIGDLSQIESKEIYDAKGEIVLPGLIDTQVHFRARINRCRGSTYW